MRRLKIGAVISGLLTFFGCSPTVNSPATTSTEDVGSALDSSLDGEIAKLIPENPDRPFYFALSMMHQPDPILERRIVSIDEVGNYMKRIESTSKEFFESIPESAGRTCSIIFALKPNRRSRLWIEYHPTPLPHDDHHALLDRLSSIDAPEVREGPVSIAMFALLWGGIGRDARPNFSMVPKEWVEAGGTIPDEPLSRVWPD